MTAYYNEHDAYAAQWLRNLIDAGHIAHGVVDERDIRDVHPGDLAGFTQCHFFAGIGVWSYALRLAGWPDERPVWTGSCPCQPFSSAGKGAGFADERHLWPHWHHLISERRPPVIFGEQVASKDADAWVDLVQDDLEALDYAFGAVPFPAASVGAPHIRDRLYWLVSGLLGNAGNARFSQRGGYAGVSQCASGADARQATERTSVHASRMADADGWHASAARQQRCREQRQQPQDGGPVQLAQSGPANGHWRTADWLLCRDGKWRPVEPDTFPLAHGAPSRVGRLRAYGNAIVAQAAAEFIGAYLDVSNPMPDR